MTESSTVKAYYEGEAEIYNKEFFSKESRNPALRNRHKYILQMISDLPLSDNAMVLDAGCGTGDMVADLMQKNWQIRGIDIAENMVSIARENVEHSEQKNEVVLQVGSVEELPYSEHQFDLVILSGVIEYLKDDEKWMSEVQRILKPGGYLILNVTNKYSTRMWTVPFINKLKHTKLVFGLMNFFKEKILRSGRLHYFPFQPRKHGPIAFDQFLSGKGFAKVTHNYFDFSIFPAPIDTLFGIFTRPLRRWMEGMTKWNVSLWGTGYIVCAKLNGELKSAISGSK